MRQTYYCVNTQTLAALEEALATFSGVTRQLFDRSLPAARREELQKERDRLHAHIGETLSNDGELLGFLSMEQTDELERAVAELTDEEVKRLLGSNIIPRQSLMRIIEALTLVRHTPASLLLFLEKAQQKQQPVIVWIL